MNIFEKILDRAGLIKKTAIPGVLEGPSGDPFSIWQNSRSVSASKALSVYSGWTYACVRAISEAIADTKLRAFEIKRDGTHEEIFEHETLDILGAVNDYETGDSLLYSISAHLELTGNAYIYLEGVKDQKGKPKALHILNPANIELLFDTTVFPKRVSEYRYTEDGVARSFKAYEVIHIKTPNPANRYEGIGTVQAAAQSIDADNYAQEFNRRYFLNGARVGGVLESSTAHTPEQLDYLRKSFEAREKGVKNAYSVLALPAGTKYIETGTSAKDMDFSNLSEQMAKRIMALFRVPRTALGITDDVNRANAEATNYVFALRTIKPKVKLIISYLNEFLVPRYGDNIYLSFVDPVPENEDLKTARMAATTGNQPIMSVNEAREEYLGLGPIENGDAVMGDFSKIPIGTPIKQDGQAKKSIKVKAEAPRTRYSKNAKIRKEISEEIGSRLAEVLTKAAEAKKKSVSEIVTMTDDDYEPIYKAFSTRVTPYERLVAAKVREVNKQQKETVLKNLPTATKSLSVKAIDKTDLFNKNEWINATVDLLSPVLSDLYVNEGVEAAALLGFTFDKDTLAGNPNFMESLNKSVELLSDRYNETTLDLLKSKIDEGMSNGLGLSELSDIVSEIYEFSDKVRADQVSRTETFRIANDANVNAWKETGVVASKKWYTATDERVCPYCGPMHGRIIDIDQTFYDDGDVVGGDDGTKIDINYSDVEAPPLHVNCRCYVRPENISLN